MSSRGMPKTKEIRKTLRKQADDRKTEYDKLTLQQKLDKLPEGHCERQRQRLLKALEEEKKPKVEATQKVEEPKETPKKNKKVGK